MGYTRDQIYAAMRAADKAGDANAVRALSAQLNGAAPQKPTSFWQGVNESLNTAGRNMAHLQDYINPVQWASNALGFGNPGTNIAQVVKKKLDASPYRGSTAGHTAGGILATLPTMAIPAAGLGGIIAQGAAGGAMMSDAHSAGGVLKDATIGAVTGGLGHGLTKGAGALVGGKNISPAARLLSDEGVTLTPGQLAGKGSIRNTIEDYVLGSIPYVNTIPQTAAARAENGLRRAVANRVLKPIGGSVPHGTQIDSKFMGTLQDQVHNTYDTATNGLGLSLDPDLINSLHGVLQDAPRRMQPGGVSQVGANVKDITSRALQGLQGPEVRNLLRDVRDVTYSSDPSVRASMQDIHGALNDALVRQNNGPALDAFNSARESETMLSRMNDAAGRAGVTNGEFGPTQLLQAAKKKGYGTNAANVANGEARLLDLATAAADVMRNKTANSGTPARLTALGLLGGGGMTAAHVNPLAAAAIGTQLLGYIPGIADIIQQASVRRPQVLQQAGRGIEATSPYIARLASILGVQGLGSPSGTPALP